MPYSQTSLINATFGLYSFVSVMASRLVVTLSDVRRLKGLKTNCWPFLCPRQYTHASVRACTYADEGNHIGIHSNQPARISPSHTRTKMFIFGQNKSRTTAPCYRREMSSFQRPMDPDQVFSSTLVNSPGPSLLVTRCGCGPNTTPKFWQLRMMLQGAHWPF